MSQVDPVPEPSLDDPVEAFLAREIQRLQPEIAKDAAWAGAHTITSELDRATGVRRSSSARRAVTAIANTRSWAAHRFVVAFPKTTSHRSWDYKLPAGKSLKLDSIDTHRIGKEAAHAIREVERMPQAERDAAPEQRNSEPLPSEAGPEKLH
jgi:hypothetical protein